MRVLFDMVHPADALFFHHAIRTLEQNGASVRIASRRKDVLAGLLDDLGHAHHPLTDARSGRIGQACELLGRDFALLALVRRWRPNVMAGFGGVAIAHVGRVTGIPSISFYDTEHAALQIALTVPFISEWHVPAGWNGREVAGRTYRFRGSKQFAYLHPDYFRAEPAAAKAAGWDPLRDNFMIRTVAWRANHDAGRSGLSLDRLRRIVSELSRRGKVHLSAEGDLPDDLAPLRVRGSPAAFHHLLAHCRLCCGESITVASEAAALGIPSVLQIDKDYGYVDEQEAAGLIRRLRADADPAPVLEAVLREDPVAFRQRARRFAADAGDVNRYVIETLSRAVDPCARRSGAA